MGNITVADYLIQQLNNIGIEDFFGLPGDFNFNIVEAVERNYGTKWIGCTNELNAGYAADGYARVKGFGAVITTYNVGELSAMNAVAGSFSESVPVVQITGLPDSEYIEQNTLLHHNFCKPDYYASIHAYSNVTQAAAMLNKDNAKKEIDRLIAILLKERKPVYISIPADVCNVEIEDYPVIKYPESDFKKLEKALEHIIKMIDNAQFPIIIGDVLTERFMAQKEFNDFVEKSGIPTTTLVMGKGLIAEDSPNFIGTYLASLDNEDVYATVNNSDCVISVGTIYSDFNTYKFDINFNPSDYIVIQGTYTIVQNKKYENVLMKDVLYELTQKISFKAVPKIKNLPITFEVADNKNGALNFDYISSRFEKFLKRDDYIFTDTGILNYFIPTLTLPNGAKWFNQLLYSSIGWAAPAVFGACMADKNRRIILLTGEGSLQLTVQSISNMIFRGLKPVIFILNNNGYTIERLLSENPFDNYNNIIPWNYTKIFDVFGGDVFTAQVRTNKEFETVLDKINNINKLCCIELFTEPMEIPYLARKVFDYNN